MRARRSKKYRKIMSTYQMAFSFRPPYQILLDAAFIRTCASFHMPLQKYLEATLHGPCKIFVTKCTLAKIMAEHEKSGGRKGSRPPFLPPPTELPLRHCKHKDAEGEETGVVPEARCLLDLLAGQPKGNEVAKNKQHYVLATADAAETERKRKGFLDVRERARLVPGVPIVYVKRSVMILEELSGASERVRRGQENDKIHDGLIGSRKRKRGEEDDGDGDDGSEDEADDIGGAKRRGLTRAKAPNPLSVRKKKPKGPRPQATGDAGIDAGAQAKKKRRGTRGKKTGVAGEGDSGGGGEGGEAIETAIPADDSS